MALQSKTLNANGANGHHKFTLTVTENSTSVANNTSSVSWSFVISPIVNSYDWISNSGKVKYSVVINGTTYSGIIATYDGVSTVTIKSGTVSVAHGADGTKSISYSFSITDSSGWSFAPGNASASGTMALATIPRQATLTAAPNFTDEESPAVTYSNPAGSAVSSLAICMTLDGSTTNIAYREISKTGTSYTFTLTDAERNVLRNASPNSNTLSVGIYLRTKIGSETYYSKLWRTMTIVNAKPTLSPTVTETNSSIATLTGGAAMVRYYSNAQVTSGAAALKGATIKSQSVSCGGATIQSGSGTFNGVLSGDFVFTVTDSRGNTTTQTVKKTFVAYVKPTCSIGNSRPDATGSFDLTASGVCFNGTITGAGTNAVTVSYRYKQSGGSYSAWKSMTATLGSNAYTARATITGLDYRATYVFQCRIVDSVTSATTAEIAINSMPVFDWGSEDFNFNVPVSAPGLTLGGVQLDYIVEQGTKDNWIYRKWNSGIMECWRRLQITTNVSTAWGSLYTSGAISSTNLTYPVAFIELPILNVNLMPFGSGGTLMVSGNAYGSATTTGALEIARGTTVSNAQYLINYQAVGRWK